jgi:flagellar protein FlgJ
MSLAARAPASALDFQGLAALRASARADRAGAAEQVARQFEGLMVQMMLRGMRSATLGQSYFGRSGQVYRDLHDQQLATRLTERRGIGLSDLLLSQLRRSGGSEGPASAGTTAVSLGPPRRGLHPSLTFGTRASAGTSTGAVSTTPRAVSDDSARPPFATRADFVRALRPHAERAGAALGVAPGILIAQAALETGWGRSLPRRSDGESGLNLFGIKADRRWAGELVTVPTLEYEGGVAVRREAAFRAYGSLAESFEDYVRFVSRNPRYARALEQAADPRAYIRELHAAGYATDPAYADKVIRLWQAGLEDGLTLASL